MIYNQMVKIKVNPRNKRHYLNLGYDVPKTGEDFFVNVNDLLPSTAVEVKCRCDVCGDDFYRIYCYIRNKNYQACDDLECIQELREKTMLNRYGHKNVGQVKHLNLHKGEKIVQTKFKNNTAPSSSNQNHLHKILGGELNYPISHYNGDIVFPKEKIVIEYDGGSHFEYVSNDVNKEKDLKREKDLLSLGWKMIHILSYNDKLYDDDKMIQIVNYAKSLSYNKIIININSEKIIIREEIDINKIIK